MTAMNRINLYVLLGAFLALMAVSCSDEPAVPGQQGGSGSGGTAPTSREGYADPAGVFIVNGGNPGVCAGSLTYIAPDGTVETDVFRKVNGSDLGRSPRALYLCGDKIYILCDDEPETAGTLFICDAKTLQLQKVFKNSDLKYDAPDNVTDTYGTGLRDPMNLAVIDERNVYVVDIEGMFRIDPTKVTTPEDPYNMTLLEGSYSFGNQTSPQQTIETITSGKSLVVSGDRLYAAIGGFWSDPGIVEFVKGEDKARHTLTYDTKYRDAAGIAPEDDGKLFGVTFTRSKKKNCEVHVFNVSGEGLVHESSKVIKGMADPGLGANLAGFAKTGGMLYFHGQTSTIKRCDLGSNKTTDYIDVTQDVKYDEQNTIEMSCNVVVDPTTNRMYVATSKDNWEGRESPQNLLVYDCSGDTPKLLQNLENQTYNVNGIYPMSQFHRQ